MDLQELAKKHAIAISLDEGDLSITSVLKSILEEEPDLRPRGKELLPIIKKIINDVKDLPDSELTKLPEAHTKTKGAANEYAALITQFKRKMEPIADTIASLMVYGSYAKGVHIVGESDLNFVLVKKKDIGEREKELLGVLDTTIQELVRPEVAHIFDLIVISEEDLSDVTKLGPAFTAIHITSVTHGTLLIGENVFKKIKIPSKDIKQAARMIFREVKLEFLSFLDSAEDQGLKTKDLAHFGAQTAINCAFAFLYSEGLGVQRNLCKPEVPENFRAISSNDSELNKFAQTIEHAAAFRIGIALTEPKILFENCLAFCMFIEKLVLS